jgi:hypothetical protein
VPFSRFCPRCFSVLQAPLPPTVYSIIIGIIAVCGPKIGICSKNLQTEYKYKM